MVDVVSAHGLDDGPEGHGAALGMGGGPVAVGLGHCGEEPEVPVTDGGEGGKAGGDVVGGVALAPDALVEGLDDGMVSGEGLTEAEGKDQLAVGQVGDDLANGPLARCGSVIDLGGGEWSDEAANAIGSGRDDGDRVLVAEIGGVGIQFHACDGTMPECGFPSGL